MENLHIEKKPNYFEKLLEIPQSSSGSLLSFDFDFPETSIPINIEQIIKFEIKKQLTPIVETQNALIDQSAELSLQFDVVKDEFDNLKKIYSENYQLKKRIRNINSLLSFKKFSSNWNDDNAEPFSENIIQRSFEIINFPTLKFQPDVFPTGRKSIQLEYEKSNGNYLEIEIFEEKYSAYSEINKEQTEYESITIDDIFRLIDDFHSRF